VLLAAFTALAEAAGAPGFQRFMSSVCTVEPCEPGRLTARSVSALADARMSTDMYGAWLTLVMLTVDLVFALAGGLLIWRRPTDRMAVFSGFVLLLTANVIPCFSLLIDDELTVLKSVSVVVSIAGLTGLALFLFVFPDGEFKPPWTRWVAVALIAATLPEAFVPVDQMQAYKQFIVLLVVGAFMGGAVGQIKRYQLSTATQKMQTKWTATGIAAALGVYSSAAVANVYWFHDPLSSGLLITTGFAGLTLIPLSIAVALLRYRLYDVDEVIGRTLVYASLTACTIAIYVFVVAYVGSLFDTDGSLNGRPLLIHLVGAGLVAVLFQPLRQGLQRSANRLLYGRRDEPYAVLSELGRRLEAPGDPAAMLPSVAETVVRALRLPYGAIFMATHGAMVEVARVGNAVPEPLRMPLLHRGEAVGELLVGHRGRKEPFGPADRRLLDDLARQAATVVEAVRLTSEVQRNEKRFRALVERSSDMITLQGPDGVFKYVSPSSRWLLGYEPAELVGRNLLQAVHVDDAALLGRQFEDLLARPGAVASARYRMQHRDGTWHWVDATARNLLDEPSVESIVVNRREVTAEVEAKQVLEQRVAERTRELTALLEVAQSVGSTLELKPLLQLILDQLGAVVPYSWAAVLVVEDDDLIALDQSGPMRAAELPLLRHGLSDWGLAWNILSEGKPVRIADIRSQEPLARVFQDIFGDALETSLASVRACMLVPLVANGRTIGIFSIAHEQPGHHSGEHARLALAFAQQAAVAIENARLFEAVRGMAAFEERQRLARELHDSVSQALYAIALTTAAAGDRLHKRDLPSTSRLLKQVRQLSRGGLAEMRALIFELRAESLEEEGLIAALTKHAAAVEARHELSIQTSLGVEPSVPLSTKEALYRIAQEALHNVVKHSGARKAEVRLQVERDGVALEVRDSGRGFDAQSAFPGHLGLRSMRERAEAVGATFEVKSAPDSGTVIRVRVPQEAPTVSRSE